MKVVGLTTTNPREAIAPLSDLQISDYTSLTVETLSALLQN